jgi:hypothetical protein
MRPNYVQRLTQTLDLAVKILCTFPFSFHTVNFELVTHFKRISFVQVSDILFRVCFKLIDIVFRVLPSSFLKCLLFEKLMLGFQRVSL